MSENNGILQYVANTPMPGAYNFTYNIFHNGNSVVNKQYQNFLANEDLSPVFYEVYPEIRSISPQAGPIQGGTLLTIKGYLLLRHIQCILEFGAKTRFVHRSLWSWKFNKSFMLRILQKMQNAIFIIIYY